MSNHWCLSGGGGQWRCMAFLGKTLTPGPPAGCGEPEFFNSGTAFPPPTDLRYSTGDVLGCSVLLFMGHQVNAHHPGQACVM